MAGRAVPEVAAVGLRAEEAVSAAAAGVLVEAEQVRAGNRYANEGIPKQT